MAESLIDVSVTCDDGVSILVSVSESTTAREILQQVIVARKSMNPSLTLLMEECAMSLDNGGAVRLLSLDSKILSSQKTTKKSTVVFKITVFGYRSKAEEVLQSQRVHDYLVSKAALELRYLIQSKGGLDQPDISYAPAVIPYSLDNFPGPPVPASDVVVGRIAVSAPTHGPSQSNIANTDLSSFDNECSEKGPSNVLVSTRSSIPNRIESLEALVHEQYLDFTDNVRDLFHDSGLVESNSGRALMDKAEELMQLGDVCGLSSVIFEYERTRKSSFSMVNPGDKSRNHSKQDASLHNASSKTIAEMRRGFEEAISRGTPRHQRGDSYSSAVTSTEFMDRYAPQKSPEYHTQEYRRSEFNPSVADRILFGGSQENRENPVSPLLLPIVGGHSERNISSSSSSSHGRNEDSVVTTSSFSMLRPLEGLVLVPGGDLDHDGLPQTSAVQATQMSNSGEFSYRSGPSISDAFDSEMMGGNSDTAGAATSLLEVTGNDLIPRIATATRVSIDGGSDAETPCSQSQMMTFASLSVIPSSLPYCGVGDDITPAAAAAAIKVGGLTVSNSEECRVTATNSNALVASTVSATDQVEDFFASLTKQPVTDTADSEDASPARMVDETTPYTTPSTCALPAFVLTDEAAHCHTATVDSLLAEAETDLTQSPFAPSTSDPPVTEDVTTESAIALALADDSAVGSEFDDQSMIEAVVVNDVLADLDECRYDTQGALDPLDSSAKDSAQNPSGPHTDIAVSARSAPSAMKALLLSLKGYSESGTSHSNKHPRLDHESPDALTQLPSNCPAGFDGQIPESFDDGGEDEGLDTEVCEADSQEKIVESTDGVHQEGTAACEEDYHPETEVYNGDEKAPVEGENVGQEVAHVYDGDSNEEAAGEREGDSDFAPRDEVDLTSRLTETDDILLDEDHVGLEAAGPVADGGATGHGYAELCEIVEEGRAEDAAEASEYAAVDRVSDDDIQPIFSPQVEPEIEAEEQALIETVAHGGEKAGTVRECITPSSVPHEDEDIAEHDQDHNQLGVDSDDDISVPVPLNYVVHADVIVSSRRALESQEKFYEETSCDALYGSSTSVIREKACAEGGQGLGRTGGDFAANGDEDADTLNEADWLDDDITIPSIGKMLDGRLPFTALTDTAGATAGAADTPTSQRVVLGHLSDQEFNTQDPVCELPCGQLEPSANCDAMTPQEEPLSAKNVAIQLKLSQLSERRKALEMRRAAIMKDEFCADDASSTDPSSSSSDEDCSGLDYSEIELEHDMNLDFNTEGPLVGYLKGQKGIGSHHIGGPSTGASAAVTGAAGSNTVGSALKRHSSNTSNMSKKSTASHASSRVSALPTLTAETLSELRRRASTTKVTIDDPSSTEPSSSSEDEDESKTDKKLTGKRGRETVASHVAEERSEALALVAPPTPVREETASSSAVMTSTRSSKSIPSRPVDAPSESGRCMTSILPCPATPSRASARLAALPSAVKSPYSAKRSRLDSHSQEEEQSIIPGRVATRNVVEDETVMMPVIEDTRTADDGDADDGKVRSADDSQVRTADDDGDADDGEVRTADDDGDVDDGNYDVEVRAADDSDNDGDVDDNVADPDYEEDDSEIRAADDTDNDSDNDDNVADSDDGNDYDEARTADDTHDGGHGVVGNADGQGGLSERHPVTEGEAAIAKPPRVSDVDLIDDIFGADEEENSIGTCDAQCCDAISVGLDRLDILLSRHALIDTPLITSSPTRQGYSNLNNDLLQTCSVTWRSNSSRSACYSALKATKSRRRRQWLLLPPPLLSRKCLSHTHRKKSKTQKCLPQIFQTRRTRCLLSLSRSLQAPQLQPALLLLLLGTHPAILRKCLSRIHRAQRSRHLSLLQNLQPSHFLFLPLLLDTLLVILSPVLTP
jgi:hypothetical protein